MIRTDEYARFFVVGEGVILFVVLHGAAFLHDPVGKLDDLSSNDRPNMDEGPLHTEWKPTGHLRK